MQGFVEKCVGPLQVRDQKPLEPVKSQKIPNHTNTWNHHTTKTMGNNSAEYPTTKTWPKKAKSPQSHAVTGPTGILGPAIEGWNMEKGIIRSPCAVVSEI